MKLDMVTERVLRVLSIYRATELVPPPLLPKLAGDSSSRVAGGLAHVPDERAQVPDAGAQVAD